MACRTREFLRTRTVVTLLLDRIQVVASFGRRMASNMFDAICASCIRVPHPKLGEYSQMQNLVIYILVVLVRERATKHKQSLEQR